MNSTFKTEIKNISSCVFTFINKTRVESVPTVSLPPSYPHHLCLEGGGAGVGGDQGEVPEGAGHHLRCGEAHGDGGPVRAGVPDGEPAGGGQAPSGHLTPGVLPVLLPALRLHGRRLPVLRHRCPALPSSSQRCCPSRCAPRARAGPAPAPPPPASRSSSPSATARCSPALHRPGSALLPRARPAVLLRGPAAGVPAGAPQGAPVEVGPLHHHPPGMSPCQT